MSGVKVLLDTNVVLGMLKNSPEVLALLNARPFTAAECAISSITRMELLGFPGLGPQEEALIRERLAEFVHLPITLAVEDTAIALRRARRIKLPDAMIAATALHHGLELLTLDEALRALMEQSGPGAGQP